ncbi:unnamed protein product [Caenorhabditis sp. 36 PRJEB53466]|nr:unnamed protein product [Caenorhabditis sp. 36 PRJEB53466]
MSVEAGRTCFLIDSILDTKPKEEFNETEEEDDEDEEEELSSSEVASENDMETASGSTPVDSQPKQDLSALHKIITSFDANKFAALRRNGHPMLVRPEFFQFELSKQLHLVQQTIQMNVLQNLGHSLPLSFVPPIMKNVTPVAKRNHTKRTSYLDQSLKNNMKKYRCDVCEKTFSRSNTLITHKRIHTGEKPFKCEHCGRAFRQPGNLTRHRLTHTTVKPYVCGLCDKAFNRASNLHTHMRTHSNM